MKKRKIISILLVSLLALSVIGCGKVENKTVENTDKQAVTDVVKEEAFTTIPEEKLVTDYMKTKLKYDRPFINDGNEFINLYFFDVQPTDKTVITRYNLEYDAKKTYDAKELHNKYADLYDTGMNALYTQAHIKNETDDTFVNKKLGGQIVSYLSDIWKNEKTDGYTLAPEFKVLSPKDAFKEYLKENKIEIKELTYPTFVTGFNAVVGANVATVKVTIKGIQNKKEFEKTLALDFYFAPSEKIRNCDKLNEKIDDTDFEIMAVSTGTVPADKFKTFFKYDINTAREKFGINQTK